MDDRSGSGAGCQDIAAAIRDQSVLAPWAGLAGQLFYRPVGRAARHPEREDAALGAFDAHDFHVLVCSVIQWLRNSETQIQRDRRSRTLERFSVTS